MRNHTKKVDIFIIMYCSIFVIFIAIIANPSLAYSQGLPGPQRQGFGPGMGLQRGCVFQPGFGGLNLQRGIMQEPPYCKMLMDRPDLNLTPRQRDDIKKLQISHMKKTFDVRTNLQINKIELKKLRFSKNPDFDRIKAKLEKISKIQLDLQIKRAKLQLDADKTLTEAQRDLLYLSPGMAVDIEWEGYMKDEETPEPDVSK